MPKTPLSKRPKLVEANLNANELDHNDDDQRYNRQEIKVSPTTQDAAAVSHLNFKSQTPKKLILRDYDSIAITPTAAMPPSSSLQAPSLHPPTESSSRGRTARTYSQSPPRSPARSPARSPTRKLELIQLSPVKNSRIALQKIYESKNEKQIERLCIDKLVLHDFKSYAGTQVVGPFHSSFSAVVGPNGSGKSNVIDSMLFVFGFRASKMRQDRLSDLIHKSENFPDLKSCSVEVHFEYVIDKPDGTTIINTVKEKLVITRKAFKNNTSKYYINGKESNYTSVTKLLKDEGIDLDHNRFLILQGEVENIAQMKPKAENDGDDGLLEYLEDIIGTAKYKPLIEKKFEEIEALNEICIEKENRFEIVDREKASLESGKDEALEFLEKEKELTLVKSKLYQYKLWQDNKKLSTTLEKLSNIKEEFEETKKKHSTTEIQMNEISKSYHEMLKNIKASQEQEKKLNIQKRNYDTERVSLEEQRKNIMKKKKKMEKELEDCNKTISNTKIKIEDLGKNESEYESQLDELNAQLQIERGLLEEIKISLKDKTIEFSDEISQHEKELEPWNLQLQGKKSQIQVKESEISLIKEGRVKLENDIENLNSLISVKIEEKISREKEIGSLRNELNRITKEVSIGDTEYTNAKEKLREMKAVLNQHRQKAIDARTSLSAEENKNQVLASLFRLQKSGRISGFYGRLGDLGAIDDRYDIAISTACPRLNDLVVETVECGQQCIEYLRKNKLGYARFILLEKLRNFDMNKISTPNNVPRLFDLVISSDPKFLPAFYSVLRDTLVVNNLKDANRVAYGNKRFRVVTLSGELIDVSGTMSGGGTQTSRGLMKLTKSGNSGFKSYTIEDVEKIEKELAAREKNFEIANETFTEMETELRRLKDRKPDVELEISKFELEITSWVTEHELMQQQLNEKQQSLDECMSNNEELSTMEHELGTLQNDYKSLQLETKSKKDRIKFLKDEIMKVGGIKLQVQSSKVDSIIQKKDILNGKHKKDKNDLKKAETELKRLSKKQSECSTDLLTSTDKLENTDGQLSKISKSLSETETLLHELEFSREESLQNSENLKDQLKEFEENLNSFKVFQLEHQNKEEKLNNLLNFIKKDIRSTDSELQSLKIRDITHTLQELDNGNIDQDEEDVSMKDNAVSVSANNSLGNSENMEGVEIETNESDVSPDANNDLEMEIDEDNNEISKGIPRISEDEFKNVDVEELEAQKLQLQDYIDTVNVNIDVLEEYARRVAEYKRRKLDLNNAVDEREKVRELLDKLKKTRFEEFMQGFGVISITLKEMYQMITMGGNAELELVDSLDPFSEGVTFSVMPPKKSWRNITNLSGGEKTLSSLALVFALHKYKPTPLYVMDEIDAALDFRNVSIVANYIKERTKNAQFIVISLRNNMFELAEQLVGIYKSNNQTKSATLQNNDIINRD
ncbi:hypothetical protein Kpol_392p8 [Vanderwaltozyma polyspora DSM 70294]|uniref:Structural maintenance of chromosomes protein n=1 Tax=Vanderwaltozyma polyspora (strain ATCC 22028 / DSM 70294 / BCRC 21397 / CBS 2163 / NBRC 10782 / NRRL Y-8283 / UCD 57-17) TaxID=436907 RepID=A7TRR9_VANPO|nr:uncharacterized protein Kpol_392p8 [Vanderwaltozyma polyspora DSM 70294]EDO15041.1 hypothetical protein Kpol_392p8 [Vanderwaltozyma polyspora DSM 70294]